MVRVLALVLAAGTIGCGSGESDRDAVRSEQAEVSRESPGRDGNGSDPAVIADRQAVLFLGTSLTAGYGLADPERGFPGLIQATIDSAGLPFRVVNAGVSGDTSAGGLARLDWLLRSPVRVLVLELGANDGLRGQAPNALRANLSEIIRRLRERYPDAEVIVAGMEAPPNLGERYTDAFRDVFAEVAQAEDAELIPFLLADVAGVAELNQADGIHPTEAGHAVIAERVWSTLQPVLQEAAAEVAGN